MMKNCFVHYMLSCLYTDLLFLFKSKCFSKEKFWIAHSQLKIQTNPVTVLDQLQAARSQKFENLNCKLYMWKNFCHVVFFGCTVNDTSQVLRGRKLPLPSGIPYRKKSFTFWFGIIRTLGTLAQEANLWKKRFSCSKVCKHALPIKQKIHCVFSTMKVWTVYELSNLLL